MSILLSKCKTLIVGSLTLDILLKVDRLPTREQDVNAEEQLFFAGGCAFNVYQAMRSCGSEPQMLTRMGKGMYAQELRSLIKEEKDLLIEYGSEENGCCYCLIEEDGERSFISVHGAEYIYPLTLIETLDLSNICYIYLCGIDLEEKKNQQILTVLKKISGIQLFFAPGPRCRNISNECWQKLYDLHPILHLNEKEAYMLSGYQQVKEAITRLYEKSNQMVIMTLGAKGSMAYDGKRIVHVPASACAVKDFVGAGDAHAGACLAMLEQHANAEQMLRQANELAAKAVERNGSFQVME